MKIVLDFENYWAELYRTETYEFVNSCSSMFLNYEFNTPS